MGETEKLLIQAMTYQRPERIPVSVHVLPKAWFDRYDDFALLSRSFPDLLPAPPDLRALRENLQPSYRQGIWTDEWGCVWENREEGMEAIVTRHPVPKREMIAALDIPQADTGRVPHGFMYLRLLDLRGFEEAMVDFAEEPDELQTLIEKVLFHTLAQLDVLLSVTASPIVWLGDDLGMQNGLAIGADRFRKYLIPCFAKIFAKVKAAGRYAYLHSDGMIYEIMPDLRAAGADMINPQYRANGLENLSRVCRGKIPIDLDLDRQLLPFATPTQLSDHVRECVETLYLPEGGLGLKLELNYEVPTDNAAAVLEALRKYSAYKPPHYT